jgi:hypothetical protein
MLNREERIKNYEVLFFRLILTLQKSLQRKIYKMKNVLVLLFIMLIQQLAFSQTIIQKDPVIEQMVKEVSADSLKTYITNLVSLGTRHTLSTQTDPKKGIGAARNWVLKKFNEFAKQSSGEIDSLYRYNYAAGRWQARRCAGFIRKCCWTSPGN